MATMASNRRRLRSSTGRQAPIDLAPSPNVHYSVCPAPATEGEKFLCLEDMNIGKRIKLAKFRHFLDLPIEIRLEIYGYFAKLPEYEDYGIQLLDFAEKESGDVIIDKRKMKATTAQKAAYDNEYAAIKKTVASLLLVCRDINAEYTPIFYRNQSFRVDTVQPPIDNPWFEPTGQSAATRRKKTTITNNDIKSILTVGTARDFQAKFLRTLTPCKLSHLGSLEYDASIFNGYVWHPDKFEFDPSPLHEGHRANGSSNVDFEGLLHLATVLQEYKDALSSLQRVMLCGVGDPAMVQPYSLDRFGSANLESVWSKTIEGPKWEEVERKLVGGQDQKSRSTAPLSGWKITRRLVLWGWDDDIVISKVHVLFEKPGIEKIKPGCKASKDCIDVSSTTTMTHPEILVQYHGWSD